MIQKVPISIIYYSYIIHGPTFCIFLNVESLLKCFCQLAIKEENKWIIRKRFYATDTIRQLESTMA